LKLKFPKFNLKFDFKSLRFRLWLYFSAFAIVLIILLWGFQLFMLTNYYEDMKIKETNNLAQELVLKYGSEDFEATLHEVASTNDVYIHIETSEGFTIYSPFFSGDMPDAYTYFQELQAVREQLILSDHHSISVKIENDRTRYDTLSYACELASVNGESVRMFIFSPLYPVESTITILKHQLLSVTAVSLLLSFIIGLYLASRVSKPLRSITNSATQLAKGKFGIVFEGDPYSKIHNLADSLTYTSIELEKADNQQKDMMANVSHDLKTPLKMVKSYAEMIRDLSGDNPEKRNAHLQVIIDEADRLNRLVEDMLLLSRMQTGSIVLDKKDFSMEESAKAILSSFDIFTEQEGYTILLDCPNDIIVNGDERKIKQVLSNLLTNAIKYCGNDRTVIVSIKQNNGKMRCEVVDHGMGIAPNELELIWDRYYKASTNHVRNTTGTGLGLSIVKEILLLHNAAYGVESHLGKGSCFWFELKI